MFKRVRLKAFIRNICWNLAVLLLLLVIVELVLSLTISFPVGYFTYEPNSELKFKVDTAYLEGISDNMSTVSFNSIGARSGELTNSQRRKIMAIGGSTTACFALNQEKTWTWLLNEGLGEDYWVGNFGRLGNDTNHHLHHLEQLFKHEGLHNVEVVLFLIGLNDLGHYLGSKSDYLNKSEYKLKLSGFAHMPDSELPFYRRLTLFKLLRKAKQRFILARNDPSYGAVQHKLRLKRMSYTHKPILPDLTAALARYDENIRKLIIKTKAMGAQPVFMTQPTLWSQGLESTYEQLLLMGGGFEEDNPEELVYYATGALAAGIESFNKLLLQICKEENVLCLDLAGVLPKTTAVFYDDCHFNVAGAQTVAEEIYRFLQKNYLQAP